jgi:hypothetical protein
VWELPWFRNERSLRGYLLGGWSMAPALVFQTGQPWDMPGNVDLAPGVSLDEIALSGKKEGQFIYGVKPCIGQRNANARQLRSVVGLDLQVHQAVAPDSRKLPQRRDEPLRRVPPAFAIHARCELREDHADHQ